MKLHIIITLVEFIYILQSCNASGENEISVLGFAPGGKGFYRKFLKPAKPVLMQNAAKRWPAYERWQNESYLLDRFGETDFTRNDNEEMISLKEYMSSKQSQGIHLDAGFEKNMLLADLQLPIALHCVELVKAMHSNRINVMSSDIPYQYTDPQSTSDQFIALLSSNTNFSLQIGESSPLVMLQGDIVFIPKFTKWQLTRIRIPEHKEQDSAELNHLTIFTALKFDAFPELAQFGADEYRLRLSNQSDEIACLNARKSVIDHMHFSDQDDDIAKLHLRIPVKNEKPEDVQLASGYTMPVLGLGTAMLNETTYGAVKDALGIGYRMYDTAYGYPDSEVQVGQAIKDSSVPRDKIFIVTKLHPRFFGYQETLDAIDESLARLQVDYIDGYLIHALTCDDFFLACQKGEPKGTWKESWRAMEDAHAQGKLRSLGVSNFESISLIQELLDWTKVPVSLLQNWFDPFHQDVTVRRFCNKHSIRYIGFSTLGTQWKLLGLDTNPVMTSDIIFGIAGHYDYVIHHVILRWAIHVNVTVIPRTANPNHLRQNFRSLDLNMHQTDIIAINRMGEWMDDIQDFTDDAEDSADLLRKSVNANLGEFSKDDLALLEEAIADEERATKADQAHVADEL